MAREAAGSRRKRYRSVCCWRRAASACRRSCQALSFTGARSSPLQARRRAAPQLTPSSRTGHDRTDFSGRHNTCKNDRRRRDNTRWTGEHETIRPLSNPPFGIGSGQRAKHISHAQTPQNPTPVPHRPASAPPTPGSAVAYVLGVPGRNVICLRIVVAGSREFSPSRQ